MKITKSKLNKMIKEEVGKLTEAPAVIEKDEAGWYINEYQIDSDISLWEEDYNLIIVKDYR